MCWPYLIKHFIEGPNKVMAVQDGFKPVPHSLEEITSDWLQNALHRGKAISEETTITKVEIEEIKNKESGISDGGGYSGSRLIKLLPIYGYCQEIIIFVHYLLEFTLYREKVNGNEPKTLVCKLTAFPHKKMKLPLRFFTYLATSDGTYDEFTCKHEALFYQNIPSIMEGTGYNWPKCYYVGKTTFKNNY